MKALGLRDLEAFATGAWILGTGGGGSPYHGMVALRSHLSDGREVPIIDASDLADDDHVAVVSTQGAPLVFLERLSDTSQAARAVEVMQEHLGLRFRAVMSVEIGGANALQAFQVAVHLGIPVVDADAMGRAYPEAQMTTFAVGDLSPAPLTSVDPRGIEVVVARVPSWKWMERTSRKVCTEFGSIAATCKAPRSGAEVKRWAIHGTVSKALELGRAVLRARADQRNPIEAILEAEDGVQLFVGKVVEVERATTEGFLRGRAVLTGLGADQGREVSLDFQNEWVLLREDGRYLASAPELICVLDTDSGDALGTETIRYGQRVTVLVLPSHHLFLTPRGLDLVGPRAFGFETDFRSVFAA